MPRPPPRSSRVIVWPSARRRRVRSATFRIGLPRRVQFGQLAADMHVDPDDLAGRAGGRLRHRPRDARAMGMPNLFSFLPVAIFSWVFASTSGFTRTAMGATLPRRVATSDSARISGSDSTLNWRMPPVQRQPHLLPRLADAGKDDPVTRHAGGAGPQVFADRDHIHPGAQIAQRLQHGDVRQRLDGKADQMRQGGQRLGEQAVMPGQGGGGIDVERGAHGGGDIGDRHASACRMPFLYRKWSMRCPRLSSAPLWART
jgi:hypothetical protein